MNVLFAGDNVACEEILLSASVPRRHPTFLLVIRNIHTDNHLSVNVMQLLLSVRCALKCAVTYFRIRLPNMEIVPYSRLAEVRSPPHAFSRNLLQCFSVKSPEWQSSGCEILCESHQLFHGEQKEAAKGGAAQWCAS